MKNTTEAGRDRLPCGMVSLKMFKISHSKALIIAYLNLRGGLKNYTFNQTDISNQTNIGKTVVRHYLKELVAEGVLNRKGKSFYKLDRQKMEALYYTTVSESDMDVSENDTDESESDTQASESDAIHSSNLNSRKLDSRKLNASENLAVRTSETFSIISSSAELPAKIPTVSGNRPVLLEKAGFHISEQPARTTPAMDTERRPTDLTPTEGLNVHSASLTVPDELVKRMRIAEACREAEKWGTRKPELMERCFGEIFGRSGVN